jgi:AraC-like DNA-binding protein
VLNVLSVREAFRLFYRNVYLPRIHYTADDGEICGIVSAIFSAFADSHSESFRRMSTLGNVTRLFACILENGYYSENSADASGAADKINLLKPVLEYIETHFSEEIKLSTLAKITGMNENYFCRFFYSLTQKTPISYVTHYRIEQAANMLLATSQTVTEVAFRCGFNDYANFIRTFKSAVGVSPGKYKAVSGL